MILLVIIAADRIKTLREQKGLSQAKLAKILNITRSSVNAWEMGVSIPSTQKIVELALLFHTTTDYILGLDDDSSLSLKTYDEKDIRLIYHLLNYIEENKK